MLVTRELQFICKRNFQGIQSCGIIFCVKEKISLCISFVQVSSLFNLFPRHFKIGKIFKVTLLIPY